MADVDCDDGLPCTTERCLGTPGTCEVVPVPNATVCDDQDACTLTTSCVDGNCLGDLIDCSAFDGICHLGSCEPGSGICFARPLVDGSACDDGLLCTASDACHDGRCVGLSRRCDDGDRCTADRCDELLGGCVAPVALDLDDDGVIDGACVVNGDCDDLDARRGPGNQEVCDGVDNDCDVATPDGYADVGADCSGDGWTGDEQCIDGGLLCRQSPLPPWRRWRTGHSFWASITSISTDHVWLLSSGEGVWHTADGGATLTRTAGTPAGVPRDIAFASESIGWVVGSAGGVSKTLDGGTTWQAQASPVTDTLYSVAARDANTAWAVGDNGAIIATVDGQTWLTQASGVGTRLGELTFVDSLRGWATGSSGVILRTVDGGTTWNRLTSGTTLNVGVLLMHPDGLNGMVGAGCILLVTDDGGDSWVPSAAKPYCSNYFWHGSVRGVGGVAMVNDYGDLASSNDGGTTWLALSDVSNLASDLLYVDRDLAFVVTNNGVRVSRDGGILWHWVPGGLDRGMLKGVAFSNRRVGWLWGDDLYYSDDGGRSWGLRVDPDGGILQTVIPEGDRAAWVLSTGKVTTITRTEDSGLSWRRVALPVGFEAASIFSLGPGHLRVIAKHDALADTTDGGASWLVLSAQAPIARARGQHWNDADHGWLLSEAGSLLRTVDGGSIWQSLVTGLPDNSLQGFCLAPSGNGYAHDGVSGLVHTANGGATFTARVVPGSGDLRVMACPSDDETWVSDGGGLFFSDDSGATWSEITDLPTSDTIKYLSAPSPGQLMALRYTDLIWTETAGR